MHFGFSYVGLIYLIMLMVPNIIWAKKKPKDYEKYVGNESKVLVALERVGEVLVTALALIFSDFNLRTWTLWSLWLVASFLLMLLYEIYWIRYFKSERTMADQYRSLLFFPVAGASLPVLAFFLLGLYGQNILMLVSVIILGIGHMGIHLAHEREVKLYKEKTPLSPENEAAGARKKSRLLVRILKGIGFAILILVFAALSFIIAVRNIRFAKHYQNFINGVDEEVYIALDGQEQYLLITGRDTSNPVIIYLHGGPASPDTMAMSTFADHLMEAYTLIGWDQRGAGKTYYKNEKTDPQNLTATPQQAQKDLDKLVDYARSRFKQDKVIIMGHSYGTVIGSQYVLNHPEKVTAFIGVGQVISSPQGDLLSYQDALEKAKAAGDDTGEMEEAYRHYMADKSLENLLALREPVNKYHPVPKESNQIWQGLSSPYFGSLDALWFLKQMSLKDFLSLNKKLFDYCQSFNALENELNYQLPIYFISGSEDWVCPVQLIEEYKDKITAPEKSFTILEGCGHSPQYDAPQEFAEAVRRVLE